MRLCILFEVVPLYSTVSPWSWSMNAERAFKLLLEFIPLTLPCITPLEWALRITSSCKLDSRLRGASSTSNWYNLMNKLDYVDGVFASD